MRENPLIDHAWRFDAEERVQIEEVRAVCPAAEDVHEYLHQRAHDESWNHPDDANDGREPSLFS